MTISVSLAELAQHIGAELSGDGDVRVSGIAALDKADATQLSFLSNRKLKAQLADSKAAAVIVQEDCAELVKGAALVMKDPYVGYAKAAQLLDNTPRPEPGIHETAIIAASAQLGDGVAVGPYVVIEDNAVIGDNVTIGAGSVIGNGAQLGAKTTIAANVTIYHGVVIGQQCMVHSQAVIGADGFGYANENGNWLRIPQTGIVEIGDNTELGAAVTIDRGALDPTVIGKGCIIDDQVHIGHNCIIGDHTAVAGYTGIAGSTHIGRYCIIGGGVGVNGHIHITDHVHVTGFTMIVKDIEEPGLYSSGIPAQPNREWRKGVARYMQLDSMTKRIKALEKQLVAPSSKQD